jgi:apolipoprotein N-acyltransferase
MTCDPSDAPSRDKKSPTSASSIARSADASASCAWTVINQASIDLALPISSGILLSIAFMPAPLDLVAWVALVPFAGAIVRARGGIELYLGAYLGGVLFSLHGQSWLQTRLIGSGPFDSNIADWFSNGCVQAAVWPLTLYVARRLARDGRWPMVLLLPVVWVAGEFVRQELGWLIAWSPFPWLQLGITQAGHLPLVQVADLGGVWAIAFVVAAVNGALFDAIRTRRLKPLAIGLLILAATWAYGALRLRQTSTVRGPSVALVPPDCRLSAAADSRADIILWSETAYPRDIDESSRRDLEAKARNVDSTLIVGAVRRERNVRFNSAAVIDPQRGYQGCYDKCFPVPWGEFRPWNCSKPGTSQREFAHGTSQPVFRVGDYTCAATICYDICFDRLFRRFAPTPDFFVCLSRETSDPTGFVPRNLLKMARLRAVETRRSVVRNVEGGFSGVVTSTGEFVSAPPRPWAGPTLIGHVPVDHRMTLAAFAGDWIPFGCWAAVLMACALPRSRDRARSPVAQA